MTCQSLIVCILVQVYQVQLFFGFLTNAVLSHLDCVVRLVQLIIAKNYKAWYNSKLHVRSNNNRGVSKMFSQSKNLANAPAIYDIVKEEDKSSLNIWLAIETKILELQAESSPKLKIKIAREISVMLAEKLTTIFELFIK